MLTVYKTLDEEYNCISYFSAFIIPICPEASNSSCSFFAVTGYYNAVSYVRWMVKQELHTELCLGNLATGKDQNWIEKVREKFMVFSVFY
jgi:hypothetical protein